MDYRLDNTTTSLTKDACKGCHSQPLSTYDWLNDIPDLPEDGGFVEVQFKNTRKGYYLNSEKIELHKGDIVAVEANPGHDIGTVTLTGKLVKFQMRKHRYNTNNGEPFKIYRIAKQGDLDKYCEAKAREYDTMIQSRQISAELNLDMKIGDVEYQGDGNKAIFYYIADERVDFRQLIRVLAETFHIRVEMKQIGARQEAGRIGGIGPCGRQLCCSAWKMNFVSVNTSAARYQDLALNPQKLTGLCAKLKCCLNYEVDAYVEARKKMPSPEIVLETKESAYHYFKADVFRREVSYSTVPNAPVNLTTISARRAFEVISQNKQGFKPVSLEYDDKKQSSGHELSDILTDNSLTRFDDALSRSRRRNGNGNRDFSDREKAGEPHRTPDSIQPTPRVRSSSRMPSREKAPRPEGGDRRENMRERSRGDARFARPYTNEGGSERMEGARRVVGSGRRPPRQSTPRQEDRQGERKEE